MWIVPKFIGGGSKCLPNAADALSIPKRPIPAARDDFDADAWDQSNLLTNFIRGFLFRGLFTQSSNFPLACWDGTGSSRVVETSHLLLV